MIRIGFIGTGNFAGQHAEILQGLGADIVACYGTNTEKSVAFSKAHHCTFHHAPEQVISRDVIDALYIAIPPFAHDGSVERMAIEKQIPFLCEKPVGLDILLCQQISDQVSKVALVTSSGYLLRYHPAFSLIKEIISRNKISSVRVCSYARMPAVHWWRKEALSGGMMVESGSHYIDLLRYLFGEVKSVASVLSSGLSHESTPECDTYDAMESLLTFQSGVIGSIGVTHLLNKIDARNDSLEIYGQDFALKVDLYRLRYHSESTVLYKELGDADWNSVSMRSSKQTLLRQESESFLKAVQLHDASFVKSTYPDAVKSLEVALAMNRSAASHQFADV